MPRRGLPVRGGFRRLTAALLPAVVLSAAACGTTPAPPVRDPNGTVLTAVTVGVIPIVDVAPIYLGQQKGFFKDRGIELTMRTASGGAAIIPGVASGQFDFGFSNVTSLMIAQTKRVPVQVVASGVASTGESGLDFGAVAVAEDSPVKTPAGLAGKKIAVNTLKNIGDVTVRESVRKAGADPNGITFVQIPFPEMPAALANRRVDAAWLVEPFLSQVKGLGGRPVAWNFVDTAKELTVATYFTSAKLVQSDPDLVRRFVEAINDSMRYANAHPDQVRMVLDSYLRLDQVTRAGMTLPNWPQKINRESLERLADLSREDGVFGDAEPDLDKLFAL